MAANSSHCAFHWACFFASHGTCLAGPWALGRAVASAKDLGHELLGSSNGSLRTQDFLPHCSFRGWIDLVVSLRACFSRKDRRSVEKELNQILSTEEIVTLSVRSGFDLLLSAVALPKGSEVLRVSDLEGLESLYAFWTKSLCGIIMNEYE